MKRLPAIFSLIGECDTFADIGCDHGFISQFVLENGLAKKVIASDISEKCLMKARKLLAKYDNVEFVCANGLDGIDANLAVIAGMGGTTILEILSAKLGKSGGEDSLSASSQAKDRLSLILQPQDHCSDVREFLVSHGYTIERDFVAKENGKFYDIMLAKSRDCAQKPAQRLDKFQLELGVNYLANDSCMQESRELLIERLTREYRKYTSFKDGGKNEDKRAFLKDSLLRLGISV